VTSLFNRSAGSLPAKGRHAPQDIWKAKGLVSRPAGNVGTERLTDFVIPDNPLGCANAIAF